MKTRSVPSAPPGVVEVVVRSDVPSEEWPAERVSELLDATPEVTWRRVPGRMTFPWPQPSAGEEREDSRPGRFVVKRIVGDVRGERWFDMRHGLGRRSPAAREFAALLALEGLGIPAPRAVLHASSRRRGVSLLVMELLPHRASIRQVVAADRDPEARARLEALRVGALAARLHDAGWYHRDLYLQHVVVLDGDGELALLDLGRARRERRPRRRWFEKDLAALAASAPESVAEALVPALLGAYFDARAIPSASRAGWIRAVQRRAKRIRSHVPRHVDPGTREGAGEERDVDARYLDGGP